jgi:ligand-binding SRPBCC domain-containing protein
MARKNQFVARSQIQASAEDLFRWHAEPGALEKLTPPWEHVTVEQHAPGIRNRDRGVLRVRLGPFRIRWIFEHRDYLEGRQFRDVQLSGPFRQWEHTHLFTAESPGICLLEDRIDYSLPLGFIGNFLGGWYVRRKLKKLFAYRHRVTLEIAARELGKSPVKTN